MNNNAINESENKNKQIKNNNNNNNNNNKPYAAFRQTHRIIYKQNALEYLPQYHSNNIHGHLITSLPDAVELNLSIEKYD